MEINTIVNGSGSKEYSMTDSRGRSLKITANENDVLISIEDNSNNINRRFSRQEFNELVKAVNA